MVVMRSQVWISVLFAFIERSYALSTTACYAKHGCDSFNLTCQGEQKIKITGAEYRYMHNRTIEKSDTCCPLNINDCKANYIYTHAVMLFTRCSGKTSCSGNRAPTPTANECPPYNVTKYTYVSYDCIPDHNILDICQAYRQASEVDIIFQGTLAITNTTATCVCSVQSQHKIYYELIDVRLFTNVHYTDGSYTCLSSNFSINNVLIKCQQTQNDRSFKYMNSPEFKGEISAKSELSEVMWLTFTRDNTPEMVWVKLKADGKFSVHCNSSLSTTSTGTTIIKQAKDDDGGSILMIIGVVAAVIILIAVVAVLVLILKRRQNNTHIYEIPNTSYDEAGNTYAVVETSTYDTILDN